jgi:hypothetical protein
MIMSWIHDMISYKYMMWPESMGTVLNPISTVEIDG